MLIDQILQTAILKDLDPEDQLNLLQDIIQFPESSQFILILVNEGEDNDLSGLKNFLDDFSHDMFCLIFGYPENIINIL